jgi:hypothetical protein
MLNRFHEENNFTLLIHGNAGVYKQGYRAHPVAVKGADALSGRWAEEIGLQQIKVPANWTGLGNAAGMNRNKLMLDMFSPDVCIAFPGGRGTANMMRISHDAGVRIIDVEDYL